MGYVLEDEAQESDWSGETESMSSADDQPQRVARDPTSRREAGTSDPTDPVARAVEALLTTLQEQNPDQVQRIREATRPLLELPAPEETRAAPRQGPQPQRPVRRATRGRPRKSAAPEPRMFVEEQEEYRRPRPRRAEPAIRVNREPVRERNRLAEFLNMQPPSFKGEADLEQAEDWLSEMEKRFRVLHCSDLQKVEFAVYMLGKRARRWWQTVTIADPDWEYMSWAHFMEKFNEETSRTVSDNKSCTSSIS